VTVTIHAGAGERFTPDDFAPLIGRELVRRPGAARAWLVAAKVTDGGAAAELTADLVERHGALEEEGSHGQGA
jgi:hypothetical protein